MGCVTAPEPHDTPLSRRELNLRRREEAVRALTATDSERVAAAEQHAEPAAVRPAVREGAPAAVPTTRRSLRETRPSARPEVPSRRALRDARQGAVEEAEGASFEARPVAHAPVSAPRASDVSQPLVDGPSTAVRRGRRRRAAQLGLVAVVAAALAWGGSTALTAAASSTVVSEAAQTLGGIAIDLGAAATAPPGPAKAETSGPVPPVADSLPVPTISSTPNAAALCTDPTFLAAVAGGEDAAVIAAAGGAEAFRAAIASGVAPCIPLDDPVRAWAVINKLRPVSPIDYAPALLAPPAGVGNSAGVSLRTDAGAALTAMVGAAQAAGVGEIALASGYRSHSTQVRTFDSLVRADGREYAELESARPGFSEHQSGLAADVVACHNGCGTLDDLAATPQGAWIVAHAWEFGWIVRYEDGYTPVTGYLPEPWHLRYIGPELARAYHDGGSHTLEEFFALPAAPDYVD